MPSLDYVLAGVVYLIADQRKGGELTAQTVEDTQARFEAWFKYPIPAAAIASSLRRLAAHGSFVECKSEGGVTSFQPLVGGGKILTLRELEESKNLAQSTLATYRRSGPEWLSEIYHAEQFADDLAYELNLEKIRPWGASPSEAIQISEIVRGEILMSLNVLKRHVEAAQISQIEKSQAQAVISAAISLSEAPTPPWRIMIELLSGLGSIAGVGAFAIEITKIIMQGHL